jgi:predicted transcriptional regulator
MSGRIASEVYEHAPEDLTQAELTVLAVLALDARETDRIARYSDLESLHRLTRLKTGTIRNALTELANRGLIVRRIETVHRGGKHQEYEVSKLLPHHRNTSLTSDTFSPKRVTPE